MRLMFVSGSFPPMRCGVGDYTERLINALADVPGNTVGLLTSEDCRLDAGNGSLDLFPIVKRWSLIEIWKVFTLFRRWAPEVVHLQYPTQGYRGGSLPYVIPLIARLTGIQVAQTWHEPVSRRSIFSVLLRCLSGGWIIVVRPQYLDLLHPVLRRLIPADRLKYVPSASSIPRSNLTAVQREELRQTYLNGQRRLVVYFGFLYRHKGVDRIFEIADPSRDRIVIIGDSDHLDFVAELRQLAQSPRWNGKATLAGFMPASDVADLLAAADAVVLPFRLGGGEWNTSIHGAVLNRAYVITTSTSRRGHDVQHRIFYAPLDDTDEMRRALSHQPEDDSEPGCVADWKEIAADHMNLYRSAFVDAGRRL